MVITQDFIDYLIGSYNTLNHACLMFEIDINDLTEEDYQWIGEEAYECPSCGWWTESSDTGLDEYEQVVCFDCAEGE